MKFTRLADWLRWQESLHPSAIDLGLERARSVWTRLGAGLAPVVITVGGTNGKGSCVAFLEAILRHAGYRTGCYTSPHLVRYNERIAIDGDPVSDDALMSAFQRVEEARGDTRLTYFEFGTLAALDIFARSRLDVAVLEVGLGGRLDAVNIVDADVSVITTIGVDHAEWLGTDRESVGREKAGIFRRGQPAVVADPDPPASVLDAADALDCPLWIADRDYRFDTGPNDWTWKGPGTVRRGLPMPAMRGRHQLRNAAAAVAVLQRMTDRLPVDQRAIRAGLLTATLQGRFQIIEGRPRVVLDVAHNPEAAAVLAGNLGRLPRTGRVLAVFGALADKDIGGMLTPLASAVDRWYLAAPDSPRALPPEALARILETSLPGAWHAVAGSVAGALAAAEAAAGEEDFIVAFGSFLVVSEILEHVEKKSSQVQVPS